ncbi:hypothetical protein [Mycobacterium colombiense]|uniref:hypothetical protein n=1 Tax=Mycobacterium colombiense TaxID=339268 RepID=UPI0010583A20|nr:hypothetical protein [Mycobacterium colombiense]
MSETLKERTWRERLEANAAVDAALIDLLAAQHEVDEARQRYNDALAARDRAVRANIAAWHPEQTT